MLGLNETEMKFMKTLSTPLRIQSFLDALPINHEKQGETCYSPRTVLLKKKAHCLEGALLAAIALRLHGKQALIMNFRTTREDEDHAVALYKVNGYWGALSKTNHAILRFRDPIYKTPRELALSYFHEYFMFENGKKTLRGYTAPINLKQFGTDWITSGSDVWKVADAIARSPHFALVPKGQERYLRPASPFERNTVRPVEWPKTNPST